MGACQRAACGVARSRITRWSGGRRRPLAAPSLGERTADLRTCARFELPCALARDAEPPPDVGQRQLVAGVGEQPRFRDEALARIESGQCFA